MIEPLLVPRESFDDPDAAVQRVREIYHAGVDHLRSHLHAFVAGRVPAAHVRAYYPSVRVRTDTVARTDTRSSYGFVAGPGTFETTLTRPELFASYYHEQFRLLRQHHDVKLEVGVSREPMPLHFSFAEHDHVEGSLTNIQRQQLRDLFDLPNLAAMDDGIANGTHETSPGQ